MDYNQLDGTDGPTRTFCPSTVLHWRLPGKIPLWGQKGARSTLASRAKNCYNRKDKVLINITHIFINTSIGNHLLSSDYPRQEFEDIDIMVPIYNEHFMCYSNTLVSLKTIYTGKKKNFSIGNYYLNALKEYERVLEITQ